MVPPSLTALQPDFLLGHTAGCDLDTGNTYVTILGAYRPVTWFSTVTGAHHHV